MNDVERLTVDLKGLGTQSATTYEDLGKFDGNLKEVDKKLLLVKKADDDLTRLCNMLDALHCTLELAKFVPAIRVQATALDQQVVNLQKPVGEAKRKADQIESKVKPWRERLETTEKGVDITRATVGIIRDNSGKAESIIIRLQSCIDKQPAGTIKANFQQKLEQASRDLDVSVVSLTGVLKELDTVVNTVNAPLENSKTLFKQIPDYLDALANVINQFSSVLAPLQGLLGALNHKITINVGLIEFTFSIRDILDHNLTGILDSVVKEFENQALKFLQPFLNALHLNVNLPGVPDMRVFDGVVADFEKVMKDISSGLDQINQLLNKVKEVQNPFMDWLSLFDQKCPIQRLGQNGQQLQRDCKSNCNGYYIDDLIVIHNDRSDILPPQGYFKIPNDLNEGAGGKYIHLCYRKRFKSEVSNNLRCISDITFIVGDNSNLNPPTGYKKIDVDLNMDAKGKFIYLCYKPSDYNDKDSVKDVVILTGDNANINPPMGYTRVNQDLNQDAKGKFIYLAYSRQ